MESSVWAALVSIGGAFLLTLGIAWLTTRFRYRVSATHLEVVLFGIVVRKVSLTDIESISRHGGTWGENWWNTYNSFRRILVIRRRSGLFKNFIITPLQRYVFRRELERAIAAAHSEIYHPEEEPTNTDSAMDLDAESAPKS